MYVTVNFFRRQICWKQNTSNNEDNEKNKLRYALFKYLPCRGEPIHLLLSKA